MSLPARRRFLVSALLAFMVIAVYAPLGRYDFIALDDARYVKDNPCINGGFSWPDIKWACENVVAGNWHPVTMLTHMADCQIYGLVAGGHHLTNVLLHTANTLLLFWLLLGITRGGLDNLNNPSSAVARLRGDNPPPASAGKKRKSGRRFAAPMDCADSAGPCKEAAPKTSSAISHLWPCALAAALFGLHPLHVESVAWIAERKDVLSGFFGLLTLLAYTHYVRVKTHPESFILNPPPAPLLLRSPFFYGLALLLFALGLMSKSMLVTWPFVMGLLDYWPLRRITSLRQPILWKLIGEKIPFLLMAMVISVITFLVQKQAGAVVPLKYFPLPARLANAMVAYAHYLGKTVWPGSLAMLYPYHRWSEGQIAFSSALVIGLSLVAIASIRRRPYLFVGWFWFVGMLVPVIGIVQVGLQAMADHYTYLPLIGIFIAFAWGLADLAAAATALRSRILVTGSVVLVALVTAMSAVQVRYWKNSETLFTHAARVTDSNTVARYILGALDDSQGKTDQASYQFTRAIKDDPGNVKARCGLAYLLLGQGNLDAAEEQYRTALEIAPNLAKAHFGLAGVLMKQHNFDEAMREYSAALRLDPDIAEARYQLAGLDSARGDAASAIFNLEQAVRLAPNWPLALNNLAWMLATQPDAKLRNGPEATRLALRAASLTGGNNPSTLDTLAAAYAQAGHYADAVTAAGRAIRDAGAAGQTNLAAEIKARLRLYQSRRPYRE